MRRLEQTTKDERDLGEVSTIYTQQGGANWLIRILITSVQSVTLTQNLDGAANDFEDIKQKLRGENPLVDVSQGFLE